LVDLQYQRNDINFKPGAFRVRGDLVEINLITGEQILKIELAGNQIEKISFSKDSPSTNYQPAYRQAGLLTTPCFQLIFG